MSHCECISREELDWSDLAKYPLEDHNYEVDNDCGRHGYYATLFRSFDDTDVNVSLHSSHSDNRIKVRLLDDGPKLRKSYTFYYYPRCKKAVGTTICWSTPS